MTTRRTWIVGVLASVWGACVVRGKTSKKEARVYRAGDPDVVNLEAYNVTTGRIDWVTAVCPEEGWVEQVECTFIPRMVSGQVFYRWSPLLVAVVLTREGVSIPHLLGPLQPLPEGGQYVTRRGEGKYGLRPATAVSVSATPFIGSCVPTNLKFV